jgi:hypothetical protein
MLVERWTTDVADFFTRQSMTDFSEHLQAALGAGYQLDRELTGGGMSRVFVAVDRVLGRNVVVKVLPPELAAGVNRERFRREIQVAAQLQHPHIVPLLSAGEQGDLLWYTMPFIEGESLRAALERGRRFTVREVVRILHDVVDALAFAHARGVIHRDIKPANILTQGSHALVTDFGVAKAISAALPITGVTSAGIAIGTPAYMAPEQLAGDAKADHRMDIYAVGLLSYELITGLSPFAGPSPRETLAAQLTRDPPPLHQVSPDVPRSLSALVMRCLAKDPAARPQTADEVLHELDSMTMPLTLPGRAGASSAPGHRTWLGVAAVAILFVVLAGAGYAVSRQHERATVHVKSSASHGAAPGATAAPPARPPRLVITHADSMAIAAAVRKKLDAAQHADSVAKVRLAAETQRKMMDSIIAANSGGAVALPARRIMLIAPTEARNWTDGPLIARATEDSLGRMLRRDKRYPVIPADSVAAAFATTRDPFAVARNLHADVIVLIRPRLVRPDTAQLQIQIFDPGAAPQFSVRVVSSPTGPKDQVLTRLETMLVATLADLDEMSRAPRRGSPPPPPQPPPFN